jgi:hypothetical protein
MSSTSLKSLDGPELNLCCTTLAVTSSHNGSFDIDLNDPVSELRVLQSALLDREMTAMDIFEFVTGGDCYSSTSIAYRILFTIPVTVA